MNVIEQLIEFHLSEPWQKSIPDEELATYFHTLINKSRLITLWDGNTLAGYIESWRLTPEQFGRTITSGGISIFDEDIETGNICYVANMSIRPEYRNSDAMKNLRMLFMLQNFNCEFITGTSKHNKSCAVKIFKRQEYWNKYIKE